ncbi:MAG: hypothetical protein LAT50_13670, partial [Ectothiorhodospiraceae bacterium]|nr:hypothetical protein [Ectothiorhodospiraceae bacterium]
MMQIGWLGDSSDGSTTSNSSNTTMSLLPEHTFVVPDTPPLEVRGGGVLCRYSGSTYQIALYDVTNGPVGAPRILLEEIQVPVEEQQVDGEEDVFEPRFDVYEFDLPTVDLAPFAGRTLAVASRFTATTPWGSRGFIAANSQQFRAGQITPPEPLSGDEADGYSPRSGAVFVDLRSAPEGQRLVLISEPIWQNTEQTLYKVFPEATPQAGDIFQYDALLASGATLEVLTDATLITGQGGNTTDAFDVMLLTKD